MTKLKAMSTTKDTKERAYISQTYALFQIIDPRYSKRTLEKCSDYCGFVDRVKDWIRDNSSRWEEAQSHLNYCENLRQQGQLGTDIDNTNPDIRWQLFIENGSPQNCVTFLSDCGRADTGCTIWTYIWKRELEISCWSRLGGSYPNEIIFSDDKGFPLTNPIQPLVNYSQFPSKDGTVDLWFSVWISGDQFTSLTLDKGQLSMQIDLYDSSKTILIDSSRVISDLQIIRGILKSVESRDHSLIRAMLYTAFLKIKPGEYNAHLTLLGASYNEGQSWIEVSVSEKKQISDLLIFGQSKATGENILKGIIRTGNENLYNNPECLFPSEAKFGLYFEITLPSGHSKNFEVWATLLRIPEVSDNKSTLVSSGEFMVVADSLGHPFINGEWGSSKNQKLLEDLSGSELHSKSSKTITLFRKKFDSIEGQIIPIKVPVRLRSSLRGGQYLLTITVSDPEKRNYILSTGRVIRIGRFR